MRLIISALLSAPHTILNISIILKCDLFLSQDSKYNSAWTHKPNSACGFGEIALLTVWSFTWLTSFLSTKSTTDSDRSESHYYHLGLLIPFQTSKHGHSWVMREFTDTQHQDAWQTERGHLQAWRLPWTHTGYTVAELLCDCTANPHRMCDICAIKMTAQLWNTEHVDRWSWN